MSPPPRRLPLLLVLQLLLLLSAELFFVASRQGDHSGKATTAARRPQRQGPPPINPIGATKGKPQPVWKRKRKRKRKRKQPRNFLVGTTYQKGKGTSFKSKLRARGASCVARQTLKGYTQTPQTKTCGGQGHLVVFSARKGTPPASVFQASAPSHVKPDTVGLGKQLRGFRETGLLPWTPSSHLPEMRERPMVTFPFRGPQEPSPRK